MQIRASNHSHSHPQERSHMQHNTHTMGVSPLNLLILMHIYKLKGQGNIPTKDITPSDVLSSLFLSKT